MAAEEADFEPASLDLVTVSQAAHWFDLDPFYAGVTRVLRPGGLLALWSYHLLRVNEDVDRVVKRYYRDILGSYWPPERRIVEEEYRGIPFPFDELGTPSFQMEADWSLDELMGFLRTWSARNLYVERHGSDPLELVARELGRAWGGRGSVRHVHWPLALRAGRRPE